MAHRDHEPALEVARGWLKQCLEEHDSCKKRAKLVSIWAIGSLHMVRDLDHDDRMPRRLLDLGSEPQCSFIKLLDIGKTTENIQYFALSHRWGPNETVKATKANVTEYKKGFQLSSLPKTFRDAAEVTRALGYQYLWIDSLCIIQDDEEDWKGEAPRMAVVYGNAVCGIAAMDSEDSDSGLFNDDMSTKADHHEPGSLNSRAWVVQERVISARTLLYTDNSVSWECRECDAKQSQPGFKARPWSESNEEIPKHPKQLFEFLRDFRVDDVEVGQGQNQYMDFYDGQPEDKDSYMPFMKAWWQFLELYTTCNLSHESDKFLAMNGIAAIPQRNTRLRNTWGLWRDFLEHELLWSIDPQGPPSKRPRRWRAPYWSWASTDDGRVVNDYYKRLPAQPRLMIKPEIAVAVNTSFDQSLPIPEWTYENYSIELKGDLRSADLVVEADEAGTKTYSIINIERTGQFSEEEEHEFRPDAPIAVGTTLKIECFLALHYDKKDLGGDQYIDIRLALLSMGKEDDRIMRRIGYIETRYTELRDLNAIDEDLWWKYVQLR